MTLPAETTSFSYGNAAWPDELTSVNGTSLTYDANGNVLTYGNMEFEWTNGRTLSQITVNPEDENGTADVYSYTYDESGIRSSKTVNGVTTYFTTKDGVILSQTDGTNTMYFQYDNSGNPTGFIYNGTQYFYLTNQMGDVIGITDNTGSLVATYTYGAWGEVLATTPATAGNAAQLAIADANPLRYRGYYLDQETGYYYLQSRYYSSSLTRFIKSDTIPSALTSKNDYVGNNVFVYCLNNAVSYSDATGEATSKKKKGPSALVKYVLAHLPKNHKNKIIDVLYKKAAGCSVYVGVQLSAKANLSENNLQSGKVKGKKKYLRIAGKYIVNVSSAGAMLKGTLKIGNNKFIACYLKGMWSEALTSSIQEKYASSKYTEMYHTLYIGLQINNLTKSAAKAAVVAACVSLGHVASAAMGVIGAYVVELAPTISVKAIVSTLIPVISEQVPRICYQYATA